MWGVIFGEKFLAKRSFINEILMDFLFIKREYDLMSKKLKRIIKWKRLLKELFLNYSKSFKTKF